VTGMPKVRKPGLTGSGKLQEKEKGELDITK
jgi:hypothetical protein